MCIRDRLMTGCLCKEMASVPVYGFVSLNKAINALHQNVRECDIEPLLLPFELAQVYICLLYTSLIAT